MNRPKPESVRIGAHRGLPLVYPDNTLVGILAAAEVADFVEIDVRRTADGKLILAHDPAIGGRVIADNPWDVLQHVDLDGSRPALLEDVLRALPNTPLDIEIKNSPLQPGFDGGGSFADAVAALARPFDVVTCFYWPTVEGVRRARRDVQTGLLVDRLGSLDDGVQAASVGGHSLVAPHIDLVRDSLEAVERTHDAGLEVFVWTVNDRPTARWLIEAGVDGIISDDPELIRQEQQR